MARLIYSRYSDERNARYAIVTGIYQDGQKRLVEKKPCAPEGLAHIQAFPRYCRELGELFRDTPVRVQPVRFTGEACLFDYIEGQPLEEKLNQFLARDEYEEVFSEIDRYFAVIRGACSGEAFEATESFEEIFGKEPIPEGARCAKLNNIDYGFGNMILSEEGMVLIDYEWCFDFPIPIDFILFRALLYFAYTHVKGQELLARGLFERYGYSPEDVEKYTRMEHAFQRYISRDTVSVSDLKEGILKRTLNIHELYAEADSRDKGKAIQVYYDYGEGFSHENSYMSEITRDGEGIALTVRNIPENAVRVRIDPRKSPCLLQIRKLENERGESLLDLCEVNGTETGNHTYVCNVPDPWIVIRKKGFTELSAVFDVAEISDRSFMQALQEGAEAQVGQIRELNGTVEQKENYINEQRGWISERDNQIRELNGTVERKENCIRRITSAAAGGDPGTEEAAVADLLPDFLQKSIIQKLFQMYRKRRMSKNAD